MEVVFVLAVFVAVCHGVEEGPGPEACDVEEDVTELVKLFPGEEYEALVRDCTMHDPVCKLAHDYLNSEEFADLFAKVRLTAEYNHVMARLKDLGFSGHLDLGERVQPAPRPPTNPRTGTGFHGFIRDVIAVLPLNSTKELFHTKMAANQCFNKFVQEIQGLHFQALLTALEKSAEFKEMKDELRDHGVDLHDIYHLYEHVLGFEMFSTVEESWDHRVKTEL